MRRRHKIAIGAAVLAGCGTGAVVVHNTTSSNTTTVTTVAGASYPRPDVPGVLNPNITQGDVAATLCVKGWTATVRPPVSYTNTLKQKLYTEHHATGGLAAFELDHRVPLGSAGNPTDPQNLWLEPIADAHVKDKLEVRVQHDICAGLLTLAQAQSIWLGDYYTAKIP